MTVNFGERGGVFRQNKQNNERDWMGRLNNHAHNIAAGDSTKRSLTRGGG